MSRLCIYFKQPDPDRWLPGDRHARRLVRRIVRGRPRSGGLGRVFLNLKAGLDSLGEAYVVNPPFQNILPEDRVAVLGVGREVLMGYSCQNKIVAGIGLTNGPDDWPTMFEEYPISVYLQHSRWSADLYRPHYGERLGVWPVGIDTGFWCPREEKKTNDVIIYQKTDKVDPCVRDELIVSVEKGLNAAGLSSCLVQYGGYREPEFREILARSRAMVFLSPHESQGLAYQECLASGVPVLAWDPSISFQSPRGESRVISTSTPYFDDRCGLKFKAPAQFEGALQEFWRNVTSNVYEPRKFILDNLTLKKSAEHFLTFFS